jgi:hypothetical protein
MDAEPLAMPTPTSGAYDGRGASIEGGYPITGGGSRSRTPVLDGEDAVRAAMAGLVLEGAPRGAPHGSEFGVRDSRQGHAFPLTQQVQVDRSWYVISILTPVAFVQAYQRAAPTAGQIMDGLNTEVPQAQVCCRLCAA